jgi:creatinine amidohydrolase/Fe(II)-dependent formamide hydrolase-like protein
VALLPVGAIEQHGPHLPLDCDAFDADYLAKAVAERCKAPRPLVLPLVSYGVSYHHEDFSGNPQRQSGDPLPDGVRHRHERRKARHYQTGDRQRTRRQQPGAPFCGPDDQPGRPYFHLCGYGESSDPDIYGMADTPNDVHAGEIETSTSLATRPHMVRSNKIKKFVPRFLQPLSRFHFQASVGWYAHTSKISPRGHGRPHPGKP